MNWQKKKKTKVLNVRNKYFQVLSKFYFPNNKSLKLGPPQQTESNSKFCFKKTKLSCCKSTLHRACEFYLI